MIFALFSLNAQIEVATDGHVSIGNASPNSYDLLVRGKMYVDVLANPYYNDFIIDGSGYPPPCPSCVSWPRLYPSTNITGSLGSSTKTWFDAHIQTVYYTTLSGPSDIRFKENVRVIKNPLQTIVNLQGVMFDYKSEMFTPRDYDGNYIDGSFQLKDRFGFSAQDAKEVIPSLVSEKNDFLNLNYIDIIPILVEAVKEQQTLISNLTNQVDFLQQEVFNSELKKSVTFEIENEDFTTSPILYQNNPNPFSENTIIQYFLSEETDNAQIIIYDMTGLQLRRIPLNDVGESSVEISEGELKAGMYIYSLIVDGKFIDSKQMIIID